MVRDRRVVMPEPHRIDQHQLAHAVAERCRIFRRDHSAEGMPDKIDVLEPETVKQIVVVKNQIRETIKLLKIPGLFRSGMPWRIHASMRRPAVKESYPFLPERTPKINHARPFSLH